MSMEILTKNLYFSFNGLLKFIYMYNMVLEILNRFS